VWPRPSATSSDELIKTDGDKWVGLAYSKKGERVSPLQRLCEATNPCLKPSLPGEYRVGDNRHSVASFGSVARARGDNR
jgi:hypothetical protein